ncbi:MAG: peptidylprolyl isomerase [Erysipelotrichaceae bacterium]|nr:peptidylprolyl isomerase [Erysipelotrichaceae bacterium]MDY5727103.1 peptidylprolyl isomerase [Erysipelotrichaceae bacterium]
MKKLTLIISILAIALTLSACGNKTANVSHNDVLIQFGKNKITTSDLYYQMLEADKGATVINQVAKYILDQEIETTDEILAEAEKQLADIKVEMEGDLSSLMKSYGFETEEELLQQIIYSVKSDKLIDKYISTNLDSIYEQYKPFKAQMIYIEINSTDDPDGEAAKQEAQLVVDLLKSGASFEEVSKEHSDKTSYGTETLYTTESKLDYNVLAYAQSVSSPALSDIILNNNKTGYYVVQVTVTNKEQLKEDFISSLKNNSDFTSLVENSYFRDHNFQLYDILTYTYIDNNYSEYLSND